LKETLQTEGPLCSGSLEASPKARRPLLFSLLWKD
jgi:hypothetical protein